MAEADPNLKDRLLNELSSSFGPATDGLVGDGQSPTPPAIPDHTLIRPIGKGSYGEVWLARTALGTLRAVKIVHRRAFDSDRPYEREFAGIRRFEPVSRSHPSQLNVLHVGRDDAAGLFYYVMELADNVTPVFQPASSTDGKPADPTPPDSPTGKSAIQPESYTPRTLRSDLQRRGRLPGDECLQISLALATALDHLHRHSLVHRDIKPSNIVFVNGIPKLADIGLVTHVEATLSFVGTEGYLPPEGPGTPQADIFSLGKVLYEMATGRDRQDYPELPTNLIEAPAADRAALAELNEVIVKACHADAKQRYQTAAELHADLALLQSGQSISSVRAAQRRLRTVVRVGALVACLALLTGLALLYQRHLTREARELARANLDLAGEKTRLAEVNARLAEENRQKEIAARENLYAADINLAHQALLANNPQQARQLLQNHLPGPGTPDLRGFEWRYLWDQSRSEELFNLPPRTNRVRVIAFQPRSQALVAAGEDGTVELWDLASRKEIDAFAVAGEVRAVTLPPGENWLGIVTTNSASVWQAKHLTVVRELPDAGWFSPDGRYWLAGRKSLLPSGRHEVISELVLWGVSSWTRTNSFTVPKSWRHPWMAEPGTWAAFSPDASLLAVIGSDAIRVLSLPDFLEVAILPQELDAGASAAVFVSISPDNDTLATSEATGFRVRLWSMSSRHELRMLPGHADGVGAVSFSPDGRFLATCGADQTIKFWTVATGQLVRSFQGQADNVVFSPDGKLLASVSYHDGVVRLWDVNAQPRRESFRDPLGPVGFNSDGGLVAFGETVIPSVLDVRNLRVTNSGSRGFPNCRAHVSRLDQIGRKPAAANERWYDPYLGNLSPNGQLVALFERWQQAMDIWDVRQGERLCSVAAVTPWASFAPKRQLVATDTTNATTTVWRLPSGAPLWVFTNRAAQFPAIVFSPEENCLVTDEGTIMKLWRIEGDAVLPVKTFNPKRNPVIGLAFSPDGSLLATGAEGGDVRLWNMPTAQEAGTLNGHTRSVISLAFSPDGRTLASMCDDRTVRLWHVATRRELLRFQSPEEDRYFFNLVFSPDSRALAARRVDSEGAITWVWYAPSFAEIARTEAKRSPPDQPLASP